MLKIISGIIFKTQFLLVTSVFIKHPSIRWRPGWRRGRGGWGKSFGSIALSNFFRFWKLRITTTQKRYVPLFRCSTGLVLVEFLSPLYDLPASYANATDHQTVDLLRFLARVVKIILVSFRVLMSLAFLRVISLFCTHCRWVMIQ